MSVELESSNRIEEMSDVAIDELRGEGDSSQESRGLWAKVGYVISSPLRWIAHFFYWSSMPSKKSLIGLAEIMRWKELGYPGENDEMIATDRLVNYRISVENLITLILRVIPKTNLTVKENNNRINRIENTLYELPVKKYIQIGKQLQEKNNSFISRIFPNYYAFLQGKRALLSLPMKMKQSGDRGYGLTTEDINILEAISKATYLILQSNPSDQ